MFTALKNNSESEGHISFIMIVLSFYTVQKNFLVSVLKVQIPEISISIYKQLGLMLCLLYAVIGSWLPWWFISCKQASKFHFHWVTSQYSGKYLVWNSFITLDLSLDNTGKYLPGVIQCFGKERLNCQYLHSNLWIISSFYGCQFRDSDIHQ